MLAATPGILSPLLRAVLGSEPVTSALFFRGSVGYTARPMGFPRIAGGDWEPLLLGIEPRKCRVCTQGLYRDQTLFRGGWSRCTICDQFIHYSCLASGRVSFLKRRPRVCKTCADAASPTATTESNGAAAPDHHAA